jgi:hypothetical protein
VSQQAVILGIPAIQLELSLQLRREMKANTDTLYQFAKVLGDFYEIHRDIRRNSDNFISDQGVEIPLE